MKALISSFFALIILASCSTHEDTHYDDDHGHENEELQTINTTEEKLNVVTSFYPLAFVLNEIAGDNIELTTLAENQEAHDYRPSPKDIAGIYNADAFVFFGAGMEPWAEDIEHDLEEKNINIIEIAHLVALYELGEGEAHDDHGHEDEHGHEEDTHEDDHEEEVHDDEHGHEEDMHDDHEEEGHDDEHGHDDHDHGSFDPHAWISPKHLIEIAQKLEASLTSIDPTNADAYAFNSQALQAKLSTIAQNYADQLSQCSQEEVITSHNAFGYISREYGFHVHSIAGISTHDEPSAKVLAELKEEAEHGIKYILTEQNRSEQFAATLARETGLSMLPVNAMEKGSVKGDNFLDTLEQNLHSFATALECNS